MQPPAIDSWRGPISAEANPVGVTIEAELHSAEASVQLLEVVLDGARSSVLHENDAYRIDLALTPRIPTHLCLTERWAAHRVEKAGRLFILPPGQPARVTSSEGQNSSMVYNLSANAFEYWLDKPLEWSDRQLEASLDVASPAMAALLAQVAAEARNPGFASQILMQSYAVQIAVQIFRYFGCIEEGAISGGLSAWRLRLIDERLNDLEQLPTLIELAGLCKLSVRHLSRAFRTSRGVSIGEYIAARRLDAAKELLRRGESVKSVSYKIGFGSTASFCYAFRKSTGMSPRQYWLPS